ncbi:unnamed protein product [Rhizophagus irregularis]|uniref:Uncharacterized protein n=1 Tax=Rhizophagus irregularis TaxID=588596 RepID=A0A2N1NRJ1_9GLOM|nr:hypothetical protein RhiirC2_707328 [Rhizophagus irregularis]CAB4386808.1 unnamed protein product [Rhizophagus irregularis]CAB5368222.1 unnamed protein product [Rhizophagus irregularis]
MNKKSLKLSSIILFYLLAFLALTIIVDAHGNHGKCKTTTTTTTTTITKTSSTCKATPTLKLKNHGCGCDKDKRGHGNGNVHGHCTKTATCTLTKIACVTPPPTCILDGKPCTGGAQNCCGKVCCDDGLCAGVGSTCTPQ